MNVSVFKSLKSHFSKAVHALSFLKRDFVVPNVNSLVWLRHPLKKCSPRHRQGTRTREEESGEGRETGRKKGKGNRPLLLSSSEEEQEVDVQQPNDQSL